MRNWSIDVNVLFEIQILVDLEICSILKKTSVKFRIDSVRGNRYDENKPKICWKQLWNPVL